MKIQKISIIGLIVFLLIALAQAQDSLEGKWVEIRTTSGAVVRGYVLSLKNGEYVIQTDYGKILIKSSVVEQIRFLKKSSALVRRRDKTALQLSKNYFLVSFGLQTSPRQEIGTGITAGSGLDLALPLILEGKRVFGLSLAPELNLAQLPLNLDLGLWSDWSKDTSINAYLLSGSLFLKKKFRIKAEKRAFAFLALGPQINKLWVKWGGLTVGVPGTYFALAWRAGFEAFAPNEQGIGLALSYYLQEGADQWDVSVSYLFR